MQIRRTLAAAAGLAVFAVTPVMAQHEVHAMPEGHGEHGAEDHAVMLDYVSDVLELDASVREAIAGDIEAIIKASQNLTELRQRAEGASASELELIHADMKAAGEQLHDHHDAVAAQLNDEQGEMFTKLLHEHLTELHRPNGDHEAPHTRRQR